MMLEQELEAQQNLCQFSQRTNYIVDWTERPINKYLKQLHKQSIPEEREEEAVHRPAAKKSSSIIREASEKYNLRKYQNKLEIINQVEYPVIDRNYYRPEDYCVLPRTYTNQQPTPSPILKRKSSVNSGSCRVVDVEFLNRKLTLFQRKHSESQKIINARSQNAQSRYTPRSLNIKRIPKPNLQQPKKILLNMEELEQIKKMISKNSRRYSVPHFRTVPQIASLNL